MTLDQLLQIIPAAGQARGALFLDPINQAMTAYGITTPARQAAFLAQIAHESGSLRYVRELASGAAYEGRADLGNTQPGDGQRYKGRGLIQITGRKNYADCSESLFRDRGLLLEEPERLEEPQYAALSAAWFWSTHGLNDLADRGDFEHITRRINGGLNGEAERLAFYDQAMEVLA
ncbi:MAG: glycoside hydrolase family 19 protein [Rhodocyclaceae bacterium]|nr:glycoside hydrolase family 19 protein [Rhodocyclaceae bacterium]